MDSRIINILIGQSFNVIRKWNNERLNQADTSPNNPLTFIDQKTRQPYYRLSVVGGYAVNSSLRKHYPTRDLDLKLTYNLPIMSGDDYYRLYRNEFNPLRARIILDFVNALNRIANLPANRPIFNKILHYETVPKSGQNQYFRAAINFNRAYPFNSIPEALNKIKTTPNRFHPESGIPILTEMVFSVIYLPRGGYSPDDLYHWCTLIDLTMFTSHKAIDVRNEPGRLEINLLYDQFYKRAVAQALPVIPSNQVNSQYHGKLDFIANIGFVLYDNYLMKYKHGHPERRWIIGQRLQYILDQLIEQVEARIQRISDSSFLRSMHEVLETLQALDRYFQRPKLDPRVRPLSDEQKKIWELIEKVIQYQNQNLLPTYDHTRIPLHGLSQITDLWHPEFTTPPIVVETEAALIQPTVPITPSVVGPRANEPSVPDASGPADASGQADASGPADDDLFLDDGAIGGSVAIWEGGTNDEALKGSTEPTSSTASPTPTGEGDPVYRRHERYPVSLEDKCLGPLHAEWINSWRRFFQQSEEIIRKNPTPSWSSEPSTRVFDAGLIAPKPKPHLKPGSPFKVAVDPVVNRPPLSVRGPRTEEASRLPVAAPVLARRLPARVERAPPVVERAPPVVERAPLVAVERYQRVRKPVVRSGPGYSRKGV